MNIEDSFWVNCKVKTIDHVAVTTRDLQAVLRDYLGLPGSELVRGPGFNTNQNVDYAFVRTASGMMIEILGMKDNSPITEHVEAGGGAYHLCFSVERLEDALQHAKNDGAIIVVEPREDDAFDGRHVAFLVHPDHGLFEFLESYPKEFKVNTSTLVKPQSNTQRNITHQNDSLEIAKQAFTRLFPNLNNDSDIRSAVYDVTPGWGSFKHLQIFMEVEQIAKVSFSADEIAGIHSFMGLVEALEGKFEK